MASPLWAAPGDITNIPAPMLGSDPPKAKDIPDGDASVSTQTGALQYSFPIEAPPGRLGMAPQLALSYSSQGSTYGGVASGWTLSIPEIRLDTSVSLLQQKYFAGLSSDPWSRERYISTLSGSRPLIPVTEAFAVDPNVYQTFRAQNDNGWIRYERMKPGQPYLWRALTPDGITHYFGDTSLGAWSSNVVKLTRSVDSFGNTIEYHWSGYQIAYIEYTSNPGAGLKPFARIEFDYAALETCGGRIPVGAQEDRRLEWIDGEKRLTKIRAMALTAPDGIEHTREYALGYDTAALSCTAAHAPVRLLASIEQSAWGTNTPLVRLPPVTFSYNRLERTFDKTDDSVPQAPWMNFQTHDSSSISTGKRDPRGWPSIQEMMLDFDGDGLLDRIALVDDYPNECAFQWQKNEGRNPSGTINFGSPITQVMPRLPWRNGTKAPDESCALNYQFTGRGNIGDPPGPCLTNNGTYLAYRWTDITGDGLVDLVAAIHHDFHYDPNLESSQSFFDDLEIAGWGSCTGDGGACSVLDAGCVENALVCKPDVGCNLVDQLLATCVSEAPRVTCDRMMRGMDQDSWSDPDVNELAPEWIEGHPAPSGACELKKPHKRCDRFPWFVYENTGGAFETLGDVQYNPIPLESETGDSAIGGGGGGFSSTAHALQDMDGDGYLDVLVRGKGSITSDPLIWWLVYRGDGTGGFHTDDSGYPYVWYVPEDALVTETCPAEAGTHCATPPPGAPDVTAAGFSSLVDLNGDGAVDYTWSRGESLQTQGFWNDGLSFSGYGPGEPQGDPVGAGVLSRSWVHAYEYGPLGPDANWLVRGWRQNHAQLVDVDNDGRPDLIESPISNYNFFPYPSTLRFNNSGSFLAPLDLNQSPLVRSGLMQRTEATGSLGDDHWSVEWDLIDMDGDGLPEQWKFPVQVGQIAVQRDTDTQPLRLLKRIDNGRGGAVEAVYASTNDPNDTVTQNASTRRALPKTEWVVETLRIYDQWDTDISKTTYKYDFPVWNQDERGRWGFRGFERVRTYAPSAALTIDEYDYTVDWSGRLASSRTYSNDDYANPKSISETVWEQRTLFGGTITTYHPTRERKWTCQNGQSESNCTASVGNRVETITDFVTIDVASTPQMYFPRHVYTTTTGTYSAGDRHSEDARVLLSDANNYRLTPMLQRRFEKTNAGVEVITRYNVKEFDPTRRVLLKDYVYFTLIADPDNHHYAVTEWHYDLSTGVTQWRRSPRHAPSGPVESYVYDWTQRFATTVTNEKFQVVQRDYHGGTGALLTESGPNVSSCGTGCTNREQTWTDIDAFGRPVANWVNRAVAGNPVWQKTQVDRTTYVDHVLAGARTRVTTGTLIDYDGTRWTNTVTELDGRGRPDIVTETTDGPVNAVTTYDYDHRGHLVAVTLPDPSQNNASTVTYTYGYDSLGRPTSMRRPAVGGTAGSGLDLSYNGLLHSRTEVAGSQGGPAARTDLVHDAFGRLTEVREYTSPTVYASTFYQYDANDNVSRIQNPENVVTELFHDFEGRRVKIVRGGRTWSYGYFPTGEIKFEKVPFENGQELQSTTTYAYDELGREKSRNVGTRRLTGTDPALFGVGTITFGYDTCLNGVGRLCTATHPSNVLTTSYEYDAEGNATLENRTFRFGGVNGTRQSRASYGPSGRLISQTYGDHQVNLNDGTVAQFEYDGRALPKAVKWKTGTQTRTVADQVRNVAGLVTLRYTNLQTSGWNESQSAWTYDPLTRVKSQEILQGPAGGFATQYAKQELDYFGQDDPQRLRHTMRRSSTQTAYYDMTFGFDQRHQLTSVNESANRFQATYQFTTSGKLDRVFVGGTPGAGNDVFARNVSYQYDPVAYDPDAPVGLKNLNTGSYIRYYDYDPAGNMWHRFGGGSPLDTFVYDGEDQLRRVTSTSGSVTSYEEYYYDHRGDRVGIVKRSSSNAVVDVRVFMGDAEVTYSPTGTLTKTFAHLSLGTPVARITNRSTLELQYHGLSNNTLLSLSPTGTTNSGFVYAPYGELVESIGAGLADQHRRFNDKYRDDLTKLSYYGVRYYDGVLLGWTQADPLFRFNPDAAWDEPRQALLYTFSGSNPVRYLDPDGRYFGQSVVRAVENTGASMVKSTIEHTPVVEAYRTGERIYDVASGKKSATKALREEGSIALEKASAIAGGGSGLKAVAMAAAVAGGQEALAGGNAKQIMRAAAEGAALATVTMAIGQAMGAAKAGCGCFVAGTPVFTSEGAKPIEQLRVGDLVWARDAASGKVELRPVLEVYSKVGRPTFHVTVETPGSQNETLSATDDHLFWTGRGWMRVDRLVPGDEIRLGTGDIGRVTSIETTGRRETVYNLEVDDFHSYYVGDLATLVHNGPCKIKPGSTKHIKLKKATNGSYTTEHSSGKRYHGKGSTSRARRSGRGVSRANNDPVERIDHTSADTDEEAFLQEAQRLNADGGPDNPNNYNRINSPGNNPKKIKQ